MEPDNDREALDFLKSKRDPEPEGIADEIVDEAEPEVVEAETEAGEPEAELVEVESEQEEEALSEDDGSLVYLIGDEEITEEQILGWKDGSLRQSDYSKKTAALADERKALESKTASLGVKEQQLTDLITVLEGEISTSKIDWEDLRDNDPSEYLRQKEVLEAKSEALNKAKAARDNNQSAQNADYVAEQQNIIVEKANWGDPVKQKADLSLIEGYVGSIGATHEQVNQAGAAWIWLALIDAAKYKSLKGKETKIKKQVSKAPRVIKPTKARVKPTVKTANEEARKRFKSTGSEKDALAYLKSRRSG